MSNHNIITNFNSIHSNSNNSSNKVTINSTNNLNIQHRISLP